MGGILQGFSQIVSQALSLNQHCREIIDDAPEGGVSGMFSARQS